MINNSFTLIDSIVICIKVPNREGEEARQFLIKTNNLNKSYKILKEGEYIFFPLNERIPDNQKWELVEKNLDTYSTKTDFYTSAKKMIPTSLHSFIPSSYDRIGDIILIKIVPELEEHSTNIGELLLTIHNVRSVFKKTSDVSTEYRTIQWECIAGEDKSVTTHLMQGLRFRLNINEVYFNTRLNNEYIRVANNTKPKNIIIDMFCGIGPFSLVCASTMDITVYACDINPKAIHYFQENIKLNKKKIIGSIELVLGDIREKIGAFPKANIIVMNLPAIAIDFLESAIGKLESKGIIYLHQFVKLRKEFIEEDLQIYENNLQEKINYLCKSQNFFKHNFIIKRNILRKVSPSKTHIVWDISFP